MSEGRTTLSETGSIGAPRFAVAALGLSALLSAIGVSIANVALPMLAEAFDAPFAQVQWVVIAYLLAVTTLIVSIGRLGDLFGRRRLLLAGLILFSAASLLCALAPSLPVLIAARALQGAGSAAMMALAMAMVGQVVPRERTGGAMGLLGSLSAVGTALGPSLGGALVEAAGWPAVFLALVPLGFGAVALTAVALPADPPPDATARRPRFDLVGTVLLGATLAAYALSMTSARGAVSSALFALALAGAAVFVAVERRIAAPLVRIGLLARGRLASGLVMNVLVSTIMMATLVVGPFYLAGGLGLGPTAIGLAMSVGPAVAALAGVPSGRLVDRIGAQTTSVAGLVALCAGALLLSLLPASLGVAAYVLPLAVMTSGYALFQAANNTAVLQGAPADTLGVTSAMLNLSRNLGLVTGASAMGAVFALATGAEALQAAGPGQIASAMQATFALAASLAAMALIAATRAPDTGAAGADQPPAAAAGPRRN